MEIINHPSWLGRTFASDRARYEDAHRLGYFDIDNLHSGAGREIGEITGWSVIYNLDGSVSLTWTQGGLNYVQDFEYEDEDEQAREKELKAKKKLYTYFNLDLRQASVEGGYVHQQQPGPHDQPAEKKGDSTIIIVAAAVALFLLVK